MEDKLQQRCPWLTPHCPLPVFFLHQFFLQCPGLLWSCPTSHPRAGSAWPLSNLSCRTLKELRFLIWGCLSEAFCSVEIPSPEAEVAQEAWWCRFFPCSTEPHSALPPARSSVSWVFPTSVRFPSLSEMSGKGILTGAHWVTLTQYNTTACVS